MDIIEELRAKLRTQRDARRLRRLPPAVTAVSAMLAVAAVDLPAYARGSGHDAMLTAVTGQATVGVTGSNSASLPELNQPGWKQPGFLVLYQPPYPVSAPDPNRTFDCGERGPLFYFTRCQVRAALPPTEGLVLP